MTIQSDIQSLTPGAIVELFELDATVVGGAVTRYHAGRNGLLNPLVWQGNTYDPFPIQAGGFEQNAQGTLPRPKVQISNITHMVDGQQYNVGVLVHAYEDLVGAKLTRRRTLVKYLDLPNFTDDLLLNSKRMDLWPTKTNVTAATDGTLAPDSTATAVKLTSSVNAGVGLPAQVGQVAAIVSGQRHTGSVFVRAGNVSTAELVLYAGAVVAQTGAIISGPGTIVQGVNAVMVTGLTSAWTQIAVTSDAGIVAADCTLYVCPARGSVGVWGGPAETPPAIGDYVYVWNGTLANGLTPAQMDSYTGSPDPTAGFPDEIWFVDRKSAETRDTIEFELTAAWDVSGVQIPRRQFQANTCAWLAIGGYRGPYCGYAGGAVATADDTPTNDLAQDRCGGRRSSCRMRFAQPASLPYGGFPGADLLS